MMSAILVCCIVLLTSSAALVSAHKPHRNELWNLDGVRILSDAPLLDDDFALSGSNGAFPFTTSLDAFDVDNVKLHNGKFLTQGSLATANYGISWASTTPNPLPGLSAFVTVNYWSIGGAPNQTDVIAVFYQGANITVNSPIKYLPCMNDPKYLTTGNGSLTIYVVNGRQSVWFGYFLGNTLSSTSVFINPVLVANTPALPWTSVTQPMHVRLALTNTPGEVLISWTQKSATTPVVKLGLISQGYTQTLTPVKTVHYNASTLCGSPANSAGWVEPGTFYTVKATNLTAGTIYYYTFGDQFTGEFSATEYNFVAPSAPATGNGKNWTAFIFGDLGTDITSVDGSKVNGNEGNQVPALNVSSALKASFHDLRTANANEDAIVMHIGDISYANGWEADWDYFHYELASQSISGYVPWMTGEGNHERDWIGTNDNSFGGDSGGECGIPYQTRFVMPRVVDSQRGDYWSVNYNNVHFVMWDTEIPYAVNSTQWLWLQNDLANVNRCVTPYIISMSHRPMLVDSNNTAPGGAGAQPLAADLRLNIEPLFQQYKVDIHLMGHHHTYQRSCPAYNSTCVTGTNFGTVYIVVGTAGAGFTVDNNYVPPSWLQVFENNKNGFLQGTITDTAMNFVFYHTNNGNQYLNFDSFSMKNQGLCQSSGTTTPGPATTAPAASPAFTVGLTVLNSLFPVFVLIFLVFWH